MNKKLVGIIASIVSLAAFNTAFAGGAVCNTSCNDRYGQCSESGAAADGCLNSWHQCKVQCGSGGFTTIKAVVTPVAPVAVKVAPTRSAVIKTAALKSKTAPKAVR